MATEMESEFRWQTLLTLAKKSSKIVEIIQKENHNDIVVKFEKCLVDFLNNNLTLEEQNRIEERTLLHIGVKPSYLSEANFKCLKQDLEVEDQSPREQFDYAISQIDEEKKIKWLTLAAQNGHMTAQNHLGHYLYVKKDYKGAVFWNQKSMAQGSKQSQNNYAHCLFYGYGVEQDKERAIALFREAAESQVVNAQFNLADCYKLGDGVTKDEREAFKWYERAANNGDVDAAFIVGIGYRDGVEDILTKNELYGYSFLQGAADRGHTPSMIEIGNDHLNKKNFQMAYNYYSHAALKGDTSGMVKLGECYQDGIGVQKDMKKAVAWYTDAAAQNNMDAKLKLGICCVEKK